MHGQDAKFDAIVIGGGHNGLVCAAYLARAGKKVCVLERRHVLGGCATTEELWPGYKVSTAAYVISLFLPQIIRELKLKEYGLTILPRNPSSFTPLPDGRSLLLGPDAGLCRREIAKFSTARCRRPIRATTRSWSAWPQVLEPVLSQAAPDPLPLPEEWREIGLGKRLRDGKKLWALYRALGRAGRRPAGGGRAAHRRGPADSRSLVRERRAEGHARHRRDHRRVPLDQLARQRVRAAAPRDGRSRRRARRVGLRARRHGRAGRRRSPAACQRPGRRDSPRVARAAHPHRSRHGACGVRLEDGTQLDAQDRRLERRRASHVRKVSHARRAARVLSRRRGADRLLVGVGEDQPRARRAAAVHVHARATASARTITARCTSARRSTTWSARTTMPNTAGPASGRSSK